MAEKRQYSEFSAQTLCRACGSSRTFARGAIKEYVDSSIISGPNLSTTLWQCRACGFRFKHPIPSHADLLGDYRGLRPDDGHWDYGPRAIWQNIHDCLPAGGGSILDVGCFRGDFLSSLEPIWQKAGVEPSASAAIEAQRRGIEVVASEVEELKGASRLYDVVTAIDVFEHLPFPTRALELLVQVAKPGGRIIIVTGNSAALSWRLSGSSYWYCALRDHVSFFRPDWFRHMAAPLGFLVRSVHRCAHKPAGYGTRVNQTVKGCAFRFYGLAPNVLRRHSALAAIGDWQVPWWTSARDHFSIELERLST